MDNLKIFADSVRSLSIDMVDNASSGHQGMPLGFADIISVLFNKSMNLCINNENRDRLILSAGHSSAMLYSALYLSGKTDLTLDDLKNFRKLNGICQGHPEINKKYGIEMTTGALGQGIATSVGIAIALKKKKINNSRVFVIVGDGDLMEGVSHESMTLASSLNLDNLIILFDDNSVCIDGYSYEYTTNNIDRFKSYGFEVLKSDGHDYLEIFNSIEKAKKSKKPVFISFKTKIGYMSSKEGTSICHGKFLSSQDILNIKEKMNMPADPFSLPDNLIINCKKSKSPEFKDNKNIIDIDDLHKHINIIKKEYINNPKENSTRKFSGEILHKLSKVFHQIIGGSADLSESTCCISKDHIIINKNNYDGNYINYGVREHAMGCSMNGLAIEGFIPYGGTFLVFSDYMRPAIRNAALMKLGVIFIMTHDSIAVGEDGATHQPIEHLSSLRSIPNLKVFRPSCDVEVAECLELAITYRDSPSVLALSRQNLKNIRKIHYDENLCKNGIYEVSSFKSPQFDNNNNLERLSIIASGSEVSLAFDIKDKLVDKDFDIRIFSAPCLELIDHNNFNSIFRENERKIIIEAGIKKDWYKYISSNKDIIIGIEEFGQSGKESDIFKYYGLDVDSISRQIKKHNNNKQL